MKTVQGGTKALSLAIAALLVLGGCDTQNENRANRVLDGDPAQGRAVISAIDCGVCHQIPGVRGAHGVVGPSLDGFGQRQLIGGELPNEPQTLTQWVRDAPSLIPATAMPSLPLSDQQARDVAAYLYTLR